MSVQKRFILQELIAEPKQQSIRLDLYLAKKIKNMSRSRAKRALQDGLVECNGTVETKSSYKVHPNDRFVLYSSTPPQGPALAEEVSLSIYFEDEHLLVVEKPSGMLVHPRQTQNTRTLYNALLGHFQDLNVKEELNEQPHIGLAHRLDRATSGIMVIGKHKEITRSLALQFREHSIQRQYIALVWGDIQENSVSIRSYLSPCPKRPKRMRSTQDPEQGQHAVTHFETIERTAFASKIRCTLETGRTNQIRVHLESIGHPLFGDQRYFTPYDQEYRKERSLTWLPFREQFESERLALHATSLGFTHPFTKKQMSFESLLPTELQKLWGRVSEMDRKVIV